MVMPQREAVPAVKIINHAGATKQMAALAAVVGAGVGAAGTILGRRRQAAVPAFIPSTPEAASADPSKQSHGPIGAFDRDASGVDADSLDSKKGKLVAFAERKHWRWLGRTLQIQSRYGELEGNNLAAAVTLQMFLALFPLLIVAAAILGFIVSGHSDVPAQIIHSMGLSGSSAQSMNAALVKAQQSRKAGSVIGLATLAWSALGVSAALQYAYNQAWQTGNRGLKDKAVGAGWMAGAAILFVASAAVSTLLNWLPAGLSAVGVAVSFLLSFALWAFTGKVLPNVDVGWRSVVPGAIVGTVGLEVLKLIGAIWVPKAVASSSGLYGSVGIVLAVLAFLLLFGKLVVYTAVTDVVFHEAKHGVAEATIQMPRPATPDFQGVTRSGRANN